MMESAFMADSGLSGHMPAFSISAMITLASPGRRDIHRGGFHKRTHGSDGQP